MKIILNADVPNLGGPGDLVEVRDGYARNYLLPRGLAIVATRGAEKQVASIRRAQQSRQIRDLDHAREVADQLTGLGSVTVSAKAAPHTSDQTDVRLFGSVSPADVVAAVRTAGGPSLDKRAVHLGRTIKSTGNYDVTVRLHPEVSVTLPVEVAAG